MRNVPVGFPSDIRLAYDPEPSYLLVSLPQRDKPALRTYRIIEGNRSEPVVDTAALVGAQ